MDRRSRSNDGNVGSSNAATGTSADDGTEGHGERQLQRHQHHGGEARSEGRAATGPDTPASGLNSAAAARAGATTAAAAAAVVSSSRRSVDAVTGPRAAAESASATATASLVAASTHPCGLGTGRSNKLGAGGAESRVGDKRRLASLGRCSRRWHPGRCAGASVSSAAASAFLLAAVYPRNDDDDGLDDDDKRRRSWRAFRDRGRG
ncbi:hypothetical protein HIM_05174 [Hirsutella minnesotensis 3608]|uniref:Uncharacterized protein n=1 Tax=Hirsutella minnesotensis 3608 TaxID=1043627 RepID=A0A0F7ZUU6_9HYPO|nr:hypothetical protein HIM_05174 [Hirsutella minnesotensis 3608]